MIQIYYGYGKGKTSALNGQAIRAHGAGLKVGVFRFLKGMVTSEDIILSSLNIFVKSFHSSEKFVIQMNKDEKSDAKKVMQEGLDFIKQNKDKFDVICLDEIIDLVDKTVALLTEEELIAFIEEISYGKELILTGHGIVPKLFEMTDLITHFDKEKHYFDKGVKARKGFEF